MRALAILVAVTAVWGVTFVQVKDAVAIYPLFAFLALRFGIASCTLAPPGLRRLRSLGVRGVGAGALAGSLLGGGYVLQTAGLERTTVSSTGFITGMYVVLTPLLALAIFRVRIGSGGVDRRRARDRRARPARPACTRGSAAGDLLVLAGAAVYSLQIVLMERFAPRYDAVAFTLVEMLTAFAALARRRGRGRAAERSARLDGVGRAARHGHLRECARVPRADLGAAAHERDADRARVLARAGVDGVLRLHARGRQARRGRPG